MGQETVLDLHKRNNTGLPFLIIEYMKLLMYVRIYILILTRRTDTVTQDSPQIKSVVLVNMYS